MSPLVERDHHLAQSTAVAIDEEKFSPIGLHVLVVDDDTLCLAVLEKMLQKCDYSVTACTRVSQAISLVMENNDRFDIVMSDVYLPGEDGFKLLEVAGVRLGLPVIMMSASGQTNLVMRSITGGACNHLIKPIRMEELRTMWQHVVRRHRQQYHNLKGNHGSDLSGKRKHSGGQQVIKDINSLKTARIHWTAQLHHQFVKAVNHTGLHISCDTDAAPKRILEIMNVEGLTRENVASHLQKYRLSLKRLSGSISEPRPVASFQAAREGEFGGTMQIRQRGKTTPSSSSLSSSSSTPKASPLCLELARDLDHATLKSLEQFQAYEQKMATNRAQSLRGLAAATAPPSYRSTNVHLDQGYESGAEFHTITHVGWLRKNLQGGGGHRASPVHDSATQSFKVNFAELDETKARPKHFALSTHQPQIQNPSATAIKTLEQNDVGKEELKRPIDEPQNIDQEELIFNHFVEEEFPHVKAPPNHHQMPTLIAAPGDLSEEYFMLRNAFLPHPG